jgi:class 3 adenylate cyclase
LACPYLIESFGLDHMWPPYEQFMGALARHARLIRFDTRGLGLSDHNVTDFSLEALIRDIDAVVTAVGFDTVDIWAPLGSVMRAIGYAVQRPSRVRNLVLHQAHESGADAFRPERIKGMAALARSDWRTAAHAMAGSMPSPISAASRLYMVGEWNRKSATGEACAGLLEAMTETSVAELLHGVATPTLILHHGSDHFVPVRFAQKVAAQIAGSRMRILDGPGGFFFATEDRARDTADAVEGFLREGDDRTPSSVAPSAPSGMAVVLFTDIVDSTALTERLGDTVFRTASRALDEGMRAAMRDAGGTPVEGKVLGDGVMGVFTSASQAIAAARRCIELSAESELQLHVGLHAGDVIHEKGNVYGGAVNIASRICGLSAPGEVLVSGTVRELARTSAGVEFEDRGEQALKGIDDAVRVYEVRWRKDGA